MRKNYSYLNSIGQFLQVIAFILLAIAAVCIFQLSDADELKKTLLIALLTLSIVNAIIYISLGGMMQAMNTTVQGIYKIQEKLGIEIEEEAEEQAVEVQPEEVEDEQEEVKK